MTGPEPTGPPGGPPPDDPAFVPDPDEPDWVVDDAGRWVATRSGLLRRGACCGSGCRHCPWVGTPWVHPGRMAR